MRRYRHPATLALAGDSRLRLRFLRAISDFSPYDRDRVRYRLLQADQRGDYGRGDGAEECAGLLFVVLGV